jgi:hypothetical protein
MLGNAKMALTGRHQEVFLRYKITGVPKKFKNQTRPLVRPNAVNFVKFLKSIS